jgi:hypothetical protein
MNGTVERLREAIKLWEPQRKAAAAYAETTKQEHGEAAEEAHRLHCLVEMLKEAEREIERLSSVSTGHKPPRHGENPDPPPGRQRPDPPCTST